jgi:Lrp/AsnC family transcriptional regulator
MSTMSLNLAEGTSMSQTRGLLPMTPIDAADRRILDVLQRDAGLSVAEIAAKVHLSPTPCWRRIQRLEAQGVIQKRVALLDPQKLNLDVTVFVSVKTSQHEESWFERFNQVVRGIPEVVEFYRMSGDVDYLLKIVVQNIRHYDAVYKRLIAGTSLLDVSSSFAMEQLKLTTMLPLECLD